MSYDLLYWLNGILFFGLFVAFIFGQREGYVQGCKDTEKRLPTREYCHDLEEQVADLRAGAFERWKASRQSAEKS